MRHQINFSSCLLSFMGTVFLASRGTAICTNWTQGSTGMDTPSSFSNSFTQFVDQIACPADAKEDCNFGRKSYDVTGERFLLGSQRESLGLSEEEADAIFKLAQDGYNKKINSRNTTENKEFITRKATVTTAWLSKDDSLLDVPPAINTSLEWTFFYISSGGTLNGCSNETLNGKTIVAAAPYFFRDERQNNQTVIAGTWGTIFYNTTKTSGAPSAERSASKVISVLVLATSILAFAI